MSKESIKNLLIIQARTASTRLPNKVLMNICGYPLLQHIIYRVRYCAVVDDIIIATTLNKADLEIVSLCSKLGVRVFCGSELDVLDRYYQIAKIIKPQNIIRITADCPFIDPKIIDNIISIHINGKYDYTSNTLLETFPDGLDTEVFSFKILIDTWNNAFLASEREHVTPYMKKNSHYKKYSVVNPINLKDKRWTVDTPEDFEFTKMIYENIYHRKKIFYMDDILSFLETHSEVEHLNRNIIRNEGYYKSIQNDYIIKENK